MANHNSTPPEGGLFHPSDLISSYTRAQAIADGVLVDVTETAKEAGFRCPVALTRAAWADCVAWSEADTRRQVPQDEAGRLWDVLWMARNQIRGLARLSQLDLFKKHKLLISITSDYGSLHYKKKVTLSG